MQLKKIQTRIFCGQKPKVFIKIKYPEQVAEPESCVTVRIFLFGAVSSKKRYLPTAPPTSEVHAALTLLFPAHLYSDCSISY